MALQGHKGAAGFPGRDGQPGVKGQKGEVGRLGVLGKEVWDDQLNCVIISHIHYCTCTHTCIYMYVLTCTYIL